MEEVTLDDNLIKETEHEYAGFWIRVLAAIIDSFVLLPFAFLYLLVLVGINSLALTLVGLLLSACYKPFMEFKYGAILTLREQMVWQEVVLPLVGHAWLNMDPMDNWTGQIFILDMSPQQQQAAF